jgi:hypothetical protein
VRRVGWLGWIVHIDRHRGGMDDRAGGEREELGERRGNEGKGEGRGGKRGSTCLLKTKNWSGRKVDMRKAVGQQKGPG